MARNITTPEDTSHAARYHRDNSLVLIGGIGVFPTSGHSGRLQVLNKQQSTVYVKIGDTQKSDASIDRKLPHHLDSASIFIKLIGHEISHGSSTDLYLRCRMDFANNAVGTEAPHFVELGIPAVNTSD